MSRNCSFLSFSLIISFCLWGCNSEIRNGSDQLGEIDFSVHANKEAQPFFQKGFLLLHSFEYEDAAENFIKAQETDSTCVMAYWGEAMTHNHPLWRYQNYEKGKAVLYKLGKTPEERRTKAVTELERDFITAVDQLYGTGSKAQRDSAYAAFMGDMHRKYPDTPEVSAFYCLSLLGSVQVGRDDKVYEQAAQLAKEIIGKNPRHPGALHYLIHSYDDPGHASLAISAADEYSVVAPSAGHALHMPSHIYLAMGMWDKVVSSNEVSWAATVERKENKKLKNDALGYHYLHWLEYGYLQQGRNAEAKKLLNDMKVYCDTLPATRARSHLVYLKTTYLVESNDWSADVSNLAVDLDELNISTRSMYYFIEGMKAYNSTDGKSLSETIMKLSGEKLLDAEKVSGDIIGVCGSVNKNIPNLLDIQQAEVMETELRALQAWMKKDTALTDSFFRKATALENTLSYSFGPPVIVKPSNELYGEWLLEINKPKEAMQHFDLTLKSAPKRVLSLQGKMKAAKMSGDEQTVEQITKTLSEISSAGSITRGS